jgi:Skp family chaperone for outer membrane proteins
MKNAFFAAALSATMLLPAAASAQNASIIIVDTDSIMSTCTACVAAQSQLRTRQTTLQNRAQTLQNQLQTEGRPIQTAVEALNGKQPDAALQQRITAFQTKERAAQEELANGQNTLQSTAAHVQQQIGARLVQVVEQIRARRNAAVALTKQGTLANSSAVEVTTEVLAALNSALPSVSVTPLPQQQQQQQRPAAARPGGR